MSWETGFRYVSLLIAFTVPILSVSARENARSAPAFYRAPTATQMVEQTVAMLQEVTGSTTGCLVFEVEHEIPEQSSTDESRVGRLTSEYEKMPRTTLLALFGTTEPLEAAKRVCRAQSRGPWLERIAWWPQGLSRDRAYVLERASTEEVSYQVQSSSVRFVLPEGVLVIEVLSPFMGGSTCYYHLQTQCSDPLVDPRLCGQLSFWGQAFVENELPRIFATSPSRWGKYEVTSSTAGNRGFMHVQLRSDIDKAATESVFPVFTHEWEILPGGKRRLMRQYLNVPGSTTAEDCHVMYDDASSMLPCTCEINEYGSSQKPELVTRRTKYVRRACDAYPVWSVEQYLRRSSYSDPKVFATYLFSLGYKFEIGTSDSRNALLSAIIERYALPLGRSELDPRRVTSSPLNTTTLRHQ